MLNLYSIIKSNIDTNFRFANTIEQWRTRTSRCVLPRSSLDRRTSSRIHQTLSRQPHSSTNSACSQILQATAHWCKTVALRTFWIRQRLRQRCNTLSLQQYNWQHRILTYYKQEILPEVAVRQQQQHHHHRQHRHQNWLLRNRNCWIRWRGIIGSVAWLHRWRRPSGNCTGWIIWHYSVPQVCRNISLISSPALLCLILLVYPHSAVIHRGTIDGNCCMVCSASWTSFCCIFFSN